MASRTPIPSAFKRYDIRGRYPNEIDKNFAKKVGMSIGAFVRQNTKKQNPKPKVIVGRDTNTTSPEITEALIEGIRTLNTDVIDLGIGPTDMIAFAGKESNSDASIMVTASHLGIEYTGFKFMYPDGTSFDNPDLEEVKSIFLEKRYENMANPKELGHLTQNKQMYNKYVQKLRNTFNRHEKNIDATIIIDTGAGATSNTTPMLLEMLGAKVIRINSDPKNGFKRHADCSEEENIAYLKDEIKKHKADMAIAHDMDGDRISAFDRNGRWITGDEMFAIFAKMLAKKGESIIASIDTSELLENVVENSIIHTRVGDPFVLKALKDSNANLAGEPNGHYALKEFIPYNSATLFALFLASKAKKIPEMTKSFPEYDIKTKKYRIEDKESKIREIRNYAKKTPGTQIISEIDGIKFRSEEYSILLRPSGTENALRVVLETRKDAEKALKDAEQKLNLIHK